MSSYSQELLLCIYLFCYFAQATSTTEEPGWLVDDDYWLMSEQSLPHSSWIFPGRSVQHRPWSFTPDQLWLRPSLQMNQVQLFIRPQTLNPKKCRPYWLHRIYVYYHVDFAYLSLLECVRAKSRKPINKSTLLDQQTDFILGALDGNTDEIVYSPEFEMVDTELYPSLLVEMLQRVIQYVINLRGYDKMDQIMHRLESKWDGVTITMNRGTVFRMFVAMNREHELLPSHSSKSRECSKSPLRFPLQCESDKSMETKGDLALDGDEGADKVGDGNDCPPKRRKSKRPERATVDEKDRRVSGGSSGKKSSPKKRSYKKPAPKTVVVQHVRTKKRTQKKGGRKTSDVGSANVRKRKKQLPF